MSEDDGGTGWRKSRTSGVQNCVEWRLVIDRVEVRNSGDRTGNVLSFTLGEWAAFVDAVRDGEADV